MSFGLALEKFCEHCLTSYRDLHPEEWERFRAYMKQRRQAMATRNGYILNPRTGRPFNTELRETHAYPPAFDVHCKNQALKPEWGICQGEDDTDFLESVWDKPEFHKTLYKVAEKEFDVVKRWERKSLLIPSRSNG